MKKIIFLLAIVATAALSNAQESTYRIGQFYEGYIVKKNGNEVRGFIQYLDESDRYKKVVFKEEKRGKKSKFKPKDISAYKVAGVEYRACNFKAAIMRDTKFLKVEGDGCIEQLSWRQYSYEDRAWQNEVVLRKDGEAISTQTFVLGFAKKMSAFIKDNKELSNKVKTKQKGYRLLSLEAIVNEYNDQCDE
jgi:hypothetical protein